MTSPAHKTIPIGSAAYLASGGYVTQTLNYLPYGEDWVDIKHNLDPSLGQYTFTGKERDEETGYGYFGARYMDHELMTMWLSVDPMSDKYPSISPYAYCAWNPVKLVDPDGRELSERMEEYAEKIISFCQRKIDALNKLSETEELTEYQQNILNEFQNTINEINAMKDDETTYYDVRLGSFGDKGRKEKGITEYYGFGDITRKGRQQHWILVSLNTDKGLFTEDGELNMLGGQTLAHELKHCYQFYNKESFFIQPAGGGEFKVYNTEALEKAAFRRGAAFGSLDRYNPDLYPNLSKGTMSDFVNGYPGCKIIKHQ